MGGVLPLLVAMLAVIGLISLTRVLGLGGLPVLAGKAEAEALAATLPGGFAPAETLLTTDRNGALLRDASGRTAVIAPLGAHFLVRLNEGEWQISAFSDGQLTIKGRDFACRLVLDQPIPDWAVPA